MIFETNEYTLFRFGKINHIEVFSYREVTFKKLSEKGKLRALEMGFSPAISIPQPDEEEPFYISMPLSEVSCPTVRVYFTKNFWTHRKSQVA